MQRRLYCLILAAVLLSFSYSSYGFKENIVGAWLFDDGTGMKCADSSGNGNDGTVNGEVKWIDGKISGALNFDGSSTYVEIPSDDSMKVLNEDDFTLCAWFRPDETPGRIATVLQQEDGNGTGRTWLFVNGDGNEIRSYLGGATTHSNASVEYGQWYHGAVSVTEDGNNDSIQLYVNGEPAGDPHVIGMESCEGGFFIGSHKSLADTDFFIGAIDEVVLIKKALTETEIQDLMESGVMGVLSVTGKGKLAVSWGALKKR